MHAMNERPNFATDGQRYTKVAVLLHWAIAGLILYNLSSGLLRPWLPRGFFHFHVSSGLTVLLLSVVRVAWRLTHRPPAFLPMHAWERNLANAVHFLFYASMLLLPISGWALISANPPMGSPGAGIVSATQKLQPQLAPAASSRAGAPAAASARRGPPMWWGIVKVPLIAPVSEIGRMPAGVASQRALHDQLETFHQLGGWAMLLLLILHIGGALKHQFGDREPELRRMSWARIKRHI